MTFWVGAVTLLCVSDEPALVVLTSGGVVAVPELSLGWALPLG